MSEQEQIVRAKLVDGKVLVEQPDGTYREAEDQTDLAYLRSLTDEEIERMAASDGTADDMPDRVGKLSRVVAFK